MVPHGSCGRRKLDKPRFEVADIFRDFEVEYRNTHAVTFEQEKVMKAIQSCRTAVLGGHAEICLDCGGESLSYNSCRNRHCPKCQAMAQARWLDKRMEQIPQVRHFHVVFTVPQELKSLFLWNRKTMYDLLFSAASKTLLQLSRAPKRLGGLPGITAVLHTWTRDIRYHSHLHCIVTGGGLSMDSTKWVPSKNRYLFPVKVIAKLFRGKVLAQLEKSVRKKRIKLPPDLDGDKNLKKLLDRLYLKNWVVYSKAPFKGARQVYQYLGRYTHRVGLSNRRILHVSPERVTFKTKNGKTASITPTEFIRRFLLHVLPDGFIKIRHYGLYASANVNGKLKTAKTLLGDGNKDGSKSDDWKELLLRLTGIDLRVCSKCGGSRLVRHSIDPVPKRIRSP